MNRGTRAALVAATTGAGAAGLTAAAAAAAATVFARRIVTPDRHRPDDVQVVSLPPGQVELVATPDTTAAGRYGLWFDGGRGHLRVGEPVRTDEVAGTVTREVLGVDVGTPGPGPARWNGYFHVGDPSALGLAFEDVVVTSPVGELPAWFVPVPGSPDPVEGTTDAVWAVMVHGRGATREECLRAVPVVHRLGMPALIAAYRNDAEAPSSPAGRYGLGDTEWVDVEAAVLHALDRGARQVVLFGWSMGGAVVLQTVARSWLAERVQSLVLDAPVVDWRFVLDHHARLNRLPAPVGRLGLAMLGSPVARRLVGLDGPVDLRALDWVGRADDLRLPVLLVHSDDDAFVPSGPSHALAAARPDLVTHVPFAGAAHTREWNVDPVAWEREVARFLLAVPG